MKIYLYMNNGGMGNQMYQYAVARKLQEDYSGEIICDLSKFSYKDSNATPRGYVLNYFCLTDKLRYSDSKFRKLLYRIKKELLNYTIKTQKPDERYKCLTRAGMFTPMGYFDYYESSDEMHAKKIYVNGLFQAYDYFDEIRPILQKEFRPRYEVSSEIQNLINKMKNENSVCVHWRRGDYLAPQYKDSLFVCDENYYKNAMDSICSRLANPIFYVFTNTKEDAEYIRTILSNQYNVEYVNLLLQETHTDVDDFWIMCNCKNYIISNSTYSWWAQYLNESSDKLVYAPSVWNRKENVTSLYQDNWNIIDVN